MSYYTNKLVHVEFMMLSQCYVAVVSLEIFWTVAFSNF